MNRCAFPLVLAFTVLLPSALVGLAQGADKIWRLGVLSPVDSPLMSTTLSELAARGFVEGRNLIVDRQAADDLARIFRGASPAELPIQGPTHFDFVVNLKTAQTLGLTIPPAILARADEVIE